MIIGIPKVVCRDMGLTDTRRPSHIPLNTKIPPRTPTKFSCTSSFPGDTEISRVPEFYENPRFFENPHSLENSRFFENPHSLENPRFLKNSDSPENPDFSQNQDLREYVFDEENPGWNTLFYSLFIKRIFLISTELTPTLTNELMAMILYHNAENENLDQYLFLNSRGGPLREGVSLYQALQVVTTKVHTRTLGYTSSMAAFILFGGHKSTRMAFPTAIITIHEPKISIAEDFVSHLTRHISEATRLYNYIVSEYVKKTGKEESVICQDMLDKDFLMTAIQAKDYGIVDLITDEEAARDLVLPKNEFPPEDDEDLIPEE